MKIVPVVTDHAVIRWMERTRGIQIDQIREIIAAEVAGAVAVGATKFTKNGLTYMLDGPKVVTVVVGDSPSEALRAGIRARGISTNRQPNTRVGSHQVNRRRQS